MQKVKTSIIVFILTVLFIRFANGQGKYIPCNLTKEESKYIFTTVNSDAFFKGGTRGWVNYSDKNFDFNPVIKALPDSVNEFRDSILVKFIVTKAGKICEICFIGGNELLYAPVFTLLEKSPDWIPGITSAGNYVHSYHLLRLRVYVNKNEKIYTIQRLGALTTYKQYVSIVRLVFLSPLLL